MDNAAFAYGDSAPVVRPFLAQEEPRLRIGSRRIGDDTRRHLRRIYQVHTELGSTNGVTL